MKKLEEALAAAKKIGIDWTPDYGHDIQGTDELTIKDLELMIQTLIVIRSPGFDQKPRAWQPIPYQDNQECDKYFDYIHYLGTQEGSMLINTIGDLDNASDPISIGKMEAFIKLYLDPILAEEHDHYVINEQLHNVEDL